jgi:hypothetical protein
VSEAVFNLTIGGLAAMAVQSALIWRDTNWQVCFSWRGFCMLDSFPLAIQ